MEKVGCFYSCLGWCVNVDIFTNTTMEELKEKFPKAKRIIEAKDNSFIVIQEGEGW